MESSELSRRRVGSVGISAILATVFAVGMLAGALINGGGHLGAASPVTDTPAFAVFEETWNLIQDRYVLPEEIDDTELMYGAARGMVTAVGDVGHSVFLDPVDAQSFRASLEGELIGIGVRLEFSGQHPEVVAPIKDSPAEAAGIQSGDLIVAIEGVDTARMSSTEVGVMLRGEEGVPVSLTIEREGDGETVDLTIHRARIEIDPVEWAELPSGLFLIRLNEFSEGAGSALEEAIETVLAANGTGIVLDMRGNPGGYVHEAERVAAQFLPTGAVLYVQQQREAEPEDFVIDRESGPAQDIPLVVLVDEHSASAAEIVAAALRDHGRAEVIGVATFGTGTVVSSFDLDDGSIVALGTAVWSSPAGESARDVGIRPTQIVELPEEGEILAIEDGGRVTAADLVDSSDAQLTAAIEELVASQSPTAAITT